MKIRGKKMIPRILIYDVDGTILDSRKAIKECQVSALERALQACPNTFFTGHAPGFWRYISGDGHEREESYPDGPVAPNGELLRLFDTYHHLHADLSAGSGMNAIRRDSEFGKDIKLE